jgi:hypothetical protein
LRNPHADSEIGISTLSWIERGGDGEPGGESNDGVLKLDFDGHLMLQFRDSMVTSDAGLLAYRELDGALGLTEMAIERLADARTGRNGRHALVGLLQSVFGCLAGGDVNDAERLRHDPAMRWIVAQLRRARWAASRRSGSRHLRTSLLLPTCPASGSTLCTAAARREASCSTWIRA